MIKECEVTYRGYTLEYSSVDTSDSVFKCTALLKLEGEDYTLLANSDADDLIKDFKDRVDKHLERVLCLTQELEKVSQMQALFDHVLVTEAQPVYEYLINRESQLISELKVLTDA